ncbi:MAG: response regulator [Chloroflexaceae bacterium]|nr:response regulator [Chloroflexaceae bacterium]
MSREATKARLMAHGYRLEVATNGNEALLMAAKLMPDLILLDVMMPGMDGFEVCRRLRADPVLADVPIIMVTALNDRDSLLQGIEAGADDFISKLGDTNELRARVRTTTRLNRYRHLLEERARFKHLFDLSPDGVMIVGVTGNILLANPAMVSMLCDHASFSEHESLVGSPITRFVPNNQVDQMMVWLQRIIARDQPVARVETRLIRLDGHEFPVEVTSGHIVWDSTPATQVIVRDITERKQAEEEIRRSHAEITRAYDATLLGWVRGLDLRDQETEGHSQRVTNLTVELAQAMGIEGESLEHIRRGALLHDIGKMGIPDSILLKPGALDDDEWALMKQHPVYAYEWLKPITYLSPALDIPYCHHERWDGSGYPRGLRGHDIPLSARIFAVVDVWDALRSDRPYRAAWPVERVREYIASLTGIHFDPDVVDVFLRILTHWPDAPRDRSVL